MFVCFPELGDESVGGRPVGAFEIELTQGLVMLRSASVVGMGLATTE